ncbi:hypothetical protein KCU83_g8013, partial [Aureobasidium melanogenum]
MYFNFLAVAAFAALGRAAPVDSDNFDLTALTTEPDDVFALPVVYVTADSAPVVTATTLGQLRLLRCNYDQARSLLVCFANNQFQWGMTCGPKDTSTLYFSPNPPPNGCQWVGLYPKGLD